MPELVGRHDTVDIVIRLPLPVEVAVGVIRAIDAHYPGALAITDHDYGDDLLVLRVDPTGRPLATSSVGDGTCPACHEVAHDATCPLVGDGRPVDGGGL